MGKNKKNNNKIVKNNEVVKNEETIENTEVIKESESVEKNKEIKVEGTVENNETITEEPSQKNEEPKIEEPAEKSEKEKTEEPVKSEKDVEKTETIKVKDKKEKKSKNKKEKKVKDENKIKLKEKFSLNLRKKWLVSGTSTLLLVAILLLAYIALNLVIGTLELPELDVTNSKVYSLSEDSKKAIEKVDQDVKIYIYGYEEESQLVKFIKKYNKVNEKITYEILTEETNYEKIKENELQEGYYVLIFESGDAKKIVDASTDFSTVDYTTYQQIDTTEQSITNAILSLMVENKPKVYFTSGHNEYELSTELSVLETYLKNESFEMETINLATFESVPEDCDVLAIMSPASDLYDIERDMILDYISKGGKIYFSTEPMPSSVEMPNIKTILSQYGVSIENGQIIELASNSSVSSSPNVFKPRVSSTHPITADIYSSNGEIWLAYSARLKFESEEALANLNVTREDILSSSNQSIFVTDLSQDIEKAIENSEVGSSTIASVMTKTISEADENSEELQSIMIVSANGSYISNYIVQSLSANYPLSYIGNNKDLAINSIANLADKEGLTIRKEIVSQATYVPTDTQKIVVKAIIFGIPVLIVLLGIVIWAYRKKRK